MPKNLNDLKMMILGFAVLGGFFFGIYLILTGIHNSSYSHGVCFAHEKNFEENSRDITYSRINYVTDSNLVYYSHSSIVEELSYTYFKTDTNSRYLEDFQNRYPSKVDCLHYELMKLRTKVYELEKK